MIGSHYSPMTSSTASSAACRHLNKQRRPPPFSGDGGVFGNRTPS
ncbi:hypothetical protein LINGRAHAP2_LOCUS28907 [Linum grandiflorum]